MLARHRITTHSVEFDTSATRSPLTNACTRDWSSSRRSLNHWAPSKLGMWPPARTVWYCISDQAPLEATFR